MGLGSRYWGTDPNVVHRMWKGAPAQLERGGHAFACRICGLEGPDPRGSKQPWPPARGTILSLCLPVLITFISSWLVY